MTLISRWTVRELVGFNLLFNLAPVRFSARFKEVPLEISIKLSGLFAAMTALHSTVVPSNPERSKDLRFYYSSVTRAFKFYQFTFPFTRPPGKSDGDVLQGLISM